MPVLIGYQSDLQHKPASVHKLNISITLAQRFQVIEFLFFVSVFVGFLKTIHFLYKIS